MGLALVHLLPFPTLLEGGRPPAGGGFCLSGNAGRAKASSCHMELGRACPLLGPFNLGPVPILCEALELSVLEQPCFAF